MSVAGNKSKLANKLLGGIVLFSLLFSACEKKDIYVPPVDDKVTLGNYYDFQTTRSVQLNVEYTTGGKVYFEVYGENPLKAESGTVLKKDGLIALAKGVTDEDGKYNLKATLPASVAEVYIYSPDFGAPTLFKAQLTDGMIGAKIDFESAIDLSKLADAGTAALATRASWNSIEKYIPNRLSGWNVWGTPSALKDEPKIDVDAVMKKYINTYLPEGGKNQSYAPYVTDNADITLYEEAAKVTLSYLGGETAAKSVLAYYCYHKDATLKDIKKAAQNACVIFPNAHGSVLGYYSGVTMKLKYIDPDGNITDGNFPKDTKIGFMVWNNGWTGQAFKYNVFYSTKALNNSNISYTATLGIKDKKGEEYNVISFEDWPYAGSLDYNDVVFVITSDPAESIVVPPAPEPTPETYTETYQGLLGFEDCWPSQGDYDMNDVVIKYYSNITCNDKNEIVSVIDKFTLVWSGANLRNGFGYELPYNMEGKTIKFTGQGSISGNVVTLFDDAKKELDVESIPGQDMPSAQPQEVSYTVTTIFDIPQSKEGIIPPYNPFITVNKSNTEVHLTNYKPTEKATNLFPSEADISDGVTTWYVCEDGFPFAIHMDARQDQSLMLLNLKPETIRIDKTYPGFAEWVKTRDPKVKWW